MNRQQFPVERRANEVIPHARGGFSQDLQAIRVTLEELYHVALENTDRIESMLRASARNL